MDKRARLLLVAQDATGIVKGSRSLQIFNASGAALGQTVYDAESGGSPIVSLRTDADGKFEGWVDTPCRAQVLVSGDSANEDVEFLPDPADIVTKGSAQTISGVKTMTAPILNDPSIVLTTDFLVSMDGTGRFKIFDSTGSVGICGALAIRDDGLADQSSAAMLVVANTANVRGNYLLAALEMDQTAVAGDNGVLRLVHYQKAGGGQSQATLRGMEIETIREAGTTSLTNSAGNLGIEIGTHLAARTAATVAVDADRTAGYTAEAVYTNSGLFFLSSGAAWFAGGTKIWRSGTAVFMGGEDGYDYYLYLNDENAAAILVHDQYGRLGLHPSSFAKVWYYDGSGVLASDYTDKTNASRASRVSSTSSIPTPSLATDYLYIGNAQTFGSVYLDILTAQTYGAGTPTVGVEYWNGSSWTSVGATLYDGTSVYTASGFICWAPASDWVKGTPAPISTADNTSRYWARLKLSGIVASGAGSCESVQPGKGGVLDVYAGPLDTTPALRVGLSGQTSLGGPVSMASTLGVTGLLTATAGVKIASGATLSKLLTGSTTWDPPNLANGAVSSANVTVTGAAVGDYAVASLSTLPNTNGWSISAFVSAANTVLVTIVNNTGGASDLASGTLKAMVLG